MRARSRPPVKWISVALALVTATMVLAGCTATGSQSTRVVPKHQVLYRKFETYPNIPVVQDVRYGTADGQALRLDVCLPQTTGATLSPRPAIVSIHGGSWAHGDKASIDWRSVCQWLASEGYVTASVDYRLAPAHPYPAAIDDIETAVRWLRAPAQVSRFTIDPTLIGAFGGSAGGNLAALLGTSGTGSLHTGDRVAAVAELSGPANLTASGAELPDFQHYVLSYLGCATLTDCPDATKASPLYQVNSSDPPFFIGHSTEERIPIAQSDALVKRLRSAGVDTTFVTVSGRLHSIAMLDKAMRDRIAAFFQATLVHTVTGQR
jgi:acetyl esterase